MLVHAIRCLGQPRVDNGEVGTVGDGYAASSLAQYGGDRLITGTT